MAKFNNSGRYIQYLLVPFFKDSFLNQLPGFIYIYVNI